MSSLKKDLIPMAICYDFDGTLAPGNMQEYGFIRSLGQTPQEFWEKSNQIALTQKADNILAYMKLMKEESLAHHLPFKKEDFKKYAKTIQLFPGVSGWFDRINTYALSKGVRIEHYIISSGLKEMVEGTVIAPYFKEIFASSFMYDENDIAVWPALSVNYTNKTQFLYRINKGCLDISDNSINRHMDDKDKPMPFKNMIYVGDGETDIPSIKTVKREGGHAIAVYQPHLPLREDTIRMIQGDDRADIITPADYREDAPLDIFVKAVIDKIIMDTYVNKVEQICNQVIQKKETHENIK